MNANARVGRHHHGFHRHHRHFRFHRHFHKHMTGKPVIGKHMGALKAHKYSKVSVKHVKSAVKRG